MNLKRGVLFLLLGILLVLALEILTPINLVGFVIGVDTTKPWHSISQISVGNDIQVESAHFGNKNSGDSGYNRWYIGYNIKWDESTKKWVASDSTYRSIFYNDNEVLRFTGTIPSGKNSFTATELNDYTKFSVSNAGNVYAAGNVGIGTSTPTQKLDVVGSVIATNIITDSVTGDSGNGHHYLESNGKIRFNIGLDTAETGSNSGSDFRIWRYNDAGTWLGTSLAIDRSSGYVGIGKDPTVALDVAGDIKASGTICDGSNNCISAGATSYWTASGNNIYYNTGNVGIGDSTPTAKLEVASPTTNIPAIRVGRMGGNPSIQGTGDWLIMDAAVSPANVGLNYYSAGNVILAYGGGNVGIGTISSPGGKLHVKDSSGKLIYGEVDASQGPSNAWAGYFSGGQGLYASSGNIGGVSLSGGLVDGKDMNKLATMCSLRENECTTTGEIDLEAAGWPTICPAGKYIKSMDKMISADNVFRFECCSLKITCQYTDTMTLPYVDTSAD